MNRDKSEALFKKAINLIPAGVNSPVRAFRSVNENPFYVKRAKGAYLYDVDENEYLDYVSSWGPDISVDVAGAERHRSPFVRGFVSLPAHGFAPA